MSSASQASRYDAATRASGPRALGLPASTPSIRDIIVLHRSGSAAPSAGRNTKRSHLGCSHVGRRLDGQQAAGLTLPRRGMTIVNTLSQRTRLTYRVTLNGLMFFPALFKSPRSNLSDVGFHYACFVSFVCVCSCSWGTWVADLLCVFPRPSY